ncbi:hypothetical protein NSTC745_00869 [Nostoc sp. DSM 114161]|jgi:hypothetical protein|uniref:hypothetical protein n=1 Tax=Nostoc sp. DSM 114161 TaxID=3440143 RepID=UPI004046183C
MEPVNISQIIAQTNIEMQRLGWTTDQEREYLIKTYGKRSRMLVANKELQVFEEYLQSQPDPPTGL